MESFRRVINITLEGSVSQISYQGPSFYLI